MGRLVGRQVDGHAKIFIASFELAEGRLQKLVDVISTTIKLIGWVLSQFMLKAATYQIFVVLTFSSRQIHSIWRVKYLNFHNHLFHSR